jgi:hypothetical protein
MAGDERSHPSGGGDQLTLSTAEGRRRRDREEQSDLVIGMEFMRYIINCVSWIFEKNKVN